MMINTANATHSIAFRLYYYYCTINFKNCSAAESTPIKNKNNRINKSALILSLLLLKASSNR